jgi:membrane protein implicated in regulation of membrane protease activity
MNLRINVPGRPVRNLVARIITIITGAVLFVGAFVFSVVFFAVILAVAVVLGSYFLWKTRHLRKQMRQRSYEGDVIEGTVISSVEIRPVGSIERRVPGE